jgi:hypothetical protein
MSRGGTRKPLSRVHPDVARRRRTRFGVPALSVAAIVLARRRRRTGAQNPTVHRALLLGASDGTTAQPAGAIGGSDISDCAVWRVMG